MSDAVDEKVLALADVQCAIQRLILAAVEDHGPNLIAVASAITGKTEADHATKDLIFHAWASAMLNAFWELMAAQMRPDAPPEALRSLVVQTLSTSLITTLRSHEPLSHTEQRIIH